MKVKGPDKRQASVTSNRGTGDTQTGKHKTEEEGNTYFGGQENIGLISMQSELMKALFLQRRSIFSHTASPSVIWGRIF